MSNCFISLQNNKEGEWSNNQRNGKGTQFFADGRKYIGDWLDDKRNGRGMFTWPEGGRYERASSKIMLRIFMILINTSDIMNDHHL